MTSLFDNELSSLDKAQVCLVKLYSQAKLKRLQLRGCLTLRGSLSEHSLSRVFVCHCIYRILQISIA